MPVEVGEASIRRAAYMKDNVELWRMQLDLVTETRERTAARLMAYRQRMRHTYNKQVIPQTFQVEDFVWKRVKSVRDVSKLEPQWSGP